MLVSATEMLKKAKAGHYAVGQFNINDLEWTKAVLTAAEELRSPVILGVSEGAGKYMAGYRTVVGMVNGMIKEMDISVPVALHLIIRSKKTLRRLQNLLNFAMEKDFLSKQKLVLLVEKKTVL